MEIIISKDQGTALVTVFQLRGALDGESYQEFINEAQKLYDAGTHNLLVDMSELTFLSSAGLSALHQTARLYRGEDRSTFEEGWAAIHAMGKERDSGIQTHVKLLNPGEKIRSVLDTVGFLAFFEIFTDMDAALASFQ
ncbi:MAG: STAS domain-containing protein [Anaerolineales bacterium]|jgi:anti-anti-sigma factor